MLWIKRSFSKDASEMWKDSSEAWELEELLKDQLKKKDDIEMCQDSSEFLLMWTRRASQISAEEGAEEGFENTMNSRDLKDQTMKSFLRTKLKFLIKCSMLCEFTIWVLQG